MGDNKKKKTESLEESWTAMSDSWALAEAERERALMQKQRGIMRRMIDSNVRLMGAGYNKLIESWKARTAYLKDKLKFVIKTLTDADAQMTMMAYNGLKQRKL